MRGIWLEAVDKPWTVSTVDAPVVRPGGVVVDVLAVRVPSYTRQVLNGELGYDLPTPFIPGPACIGRISQVAEDVLNLIEGQVVLCNSLLSSGDLVDSPEQILVGWTGSGTKRSDQMQHLWRNGSFAEKAMYPSTSVVPLPGAETWERVELLPFLASTAIADGAVRRSGLRGGQSVIINGATGSLGCGAVLSSLARGASKVVVTGRRKDALDRLRQIDDRIRPVSMSGDRRLDTDALLEVSDGGTEILIDVISNTPTPDPTLSCIDALRRGGTAVLVGGVRHEIGISYQRIQRQELTITGSFMFTSESAFELWKMVESRVIDLSVVKPSIFDLDHFDDAVKEAEQLSGFAYSVLIP